MTVRLIFTHVTHFEVQVGLLVGISRTTCDSLVVSFYGLSNYISVDYSVPQVRNSLK